MCEEFEPHCERSEQSDVLMGQSIILSEIQAEVPLMNDIPEHQNLQVQIYEERIDLLSQEDKVSKFSMDAGFVHVVEIGQYFMTKDTQERFFAWRCREYTLPRNEKSSQAKGWIHGNTIIGPVLEVTTSCLHGKYGIEVKIWSLSGNNSQSWVRISNGSTKFVTDSNFNNTEVPADLPEEQEPQLNVKVRAARSKAKAKPQRREPVEVPSTIPMSERKWIFIEPSEPSLSAYEVSKKVINLLRHSQTVQREDDGAVQFWKIKNFLQNQFPQTLSHSKRIPKRTRRRTHTRTHARAHMRLAHRVFPRLWLWLWGGVGWGGVVWCGVVWCGVVWCGVVVWCVVWGVGCGVWCVCVCVG